ncbi:MAG: hypothetical protein ACFFG0_16380 [Candidatus Thorarchaeota archaeon]
MENKKSIESFFKLLGIDSPEKRESVLNFEFLNQRKINQEQDFTIEEIIIDE